MKTMTCGEQFQAYGRTFTVTAVVASGVYTTRDDGERGFFSNEDLRSLLSKNH